MAPLGGKEQPMPGVAVGKKRATPLPDDESRPTVFTMKGTPEWKDWLTRLSKHCRMKSSVVVDLALVDFAKKMGFNEPPPER
jgi:hypothetical protein